MQVFFENDRLIFAPDNAADRDGLALWWAQLQTTTEPGAKGPIVTAATAEKALVLFIPQR